MLHQAIAYIQYYLRAQTKFRIHSPSLFDFVNDVVEDDRDYYCFGKIEGVRARLLQNHTIIEVKDLGAGSSYNRSNSRKVSQIASTAVSSFSKCKLLYRIVHYYRPQRILELGTSLGISTSYLAHIASTTTIEGSDSIAKIAEKSFQLLGLSVHQLIGDIGDQLLKLEVNKDNFDVIVVDGNHRKAPTLKYFETCFSILRQPGVIIFDDIYWSKEMTEAWELIKADPRVSRSIDLYTFGIVEIGFNNHGGHHSLISSRLKPFQFGFLSTEKN